jgi:hypothetical protein
MLSFAWLAEVAVVVELCVSMVGFAIALAGMHAICRGIQIVLQQTGVQGECTIGFSLVLFV